MGPVAHFGIAILSADRKKLGCCAAPRRIARNGLPPLQKLFQLGYDIFTINLNFMNCTGCRFEGEAPHDRQDAGLLRNRQFARQGR
jgi:hypothetical protein